ncbi:MAG TPA: hypothetical protein VNZ86_01000, partial [Bacteroidia bacterium]|nr:hypothetical protein [Bacteroidia bacterium]
QLWSVPYALYATNSPVGPAGPTGPPGPAGIGPAGPTGATGATGATGSVANAWMLNGNAGTNRNTNFIGTSDNQPAVFKANNMEGFHIDSAGNIGIGRKVATSRLSIYGNASYTKPLLGVYDSAGRNMTLVQLIANGGGDAIDISQNKGGLGLNLLSSTTTSPAAHIELVSGANPNNAIEGVTSGTGGAGFFQINNTSSTAAALNVTTNGTGYAGSFTGTVNIAGTASELNRTQTGAANLVPIAYGNITAAGVINPGSSGNFTVSHPALGSFTITISGETFAIDKYTTVATLNSGSIGFIAVNASGTNLVVQTASTLGVGADYSFNFVVYKP